MRERLIVRLAYVPMISSAFMLENVAQSNL